jgi:hypothetical protein
MVMVGFGAGLTWAAAALEWGVPEPTKPRPWFIRWIADVWYFLAGVRSIVRRSERHLYDRIMGPEGADGMRGELRQRTDLLREKISGRARPEPQKLPPPSPPTPESPEGDQGNKPSN